MIPFHTESKTDAAQCRLEEGANCSVGEKWRNFAYFLSRQGLSSAFGRYKHSIPADMFLSFCLISKVFVSPLRPNNDNPNYMIQCGQCVRIDHFY